MAPSENQQRLIEEAYRRSELALEIQHNVAIAFDQRSLVLSALAIAASAFVFGELNGAISHSFVVGSSAFFALSAVFGAVSALPQKVFTSGGLASELFPYVARDEQYHDVVYLLCRENDTCIRRNEELRKTRGHYYKLAIVFFSFASLLCLIALVMEPPKAVTQ